LRAIRNRRRWILGSVAIAALLLAATAIWQARPVQAQEGSRVFRLPVVSVGAGESLIMSFSNLGGRNTIVGMQFFNAKTGALVGGLKDIAVASGAGETTTYTNSSGSPLSIVGVAQLAEPRPDPLLSLQLNDAGGNFEWLAEPRPDPNLMFVF
jgi:hypothetical protein